MAVSSAIFLYFAFILYLVLEPCLSKEQEGPDSEPLLPSIDRSTEREAGEQQDVAGARLGGNGERNAMLPSCAEQIP